MPIDLVATDIAGLAGELRAGRLSAAAIAEAAIDAHGRREEALNAHRAFDAALMRRQAAAADALLAAGCDLGPFMGLPVSVKDLFGLAGFRTWAGTPRALPAEHEREGAFVGAFRRQAALLAAKTHTVEFAFGGLGTNRHWGAPRNPWDGATHRVPGGSSSGAGVGLWQGSSMLALGSDTTGSVRMPASWTGTVGVKVSRGRWTTDGLLQQSETLDTPGILARSAADAALGFAALDAVPGDALAWAAAQAARPLDGLRIGIVRKPFLEGCEAGIAERVEEALRALEAGGARLVDFDLPEAVPAYELWLAGHLSAPEAHATLVERFAEWIPEIDPNIWARISSFGEMPAGEYVRRRRRILGWMEATEARMSTIDAIAMPTIPISPPALAEVEALEGYRARNTAASRNAAVISLLDCCATTLPVGLDAARMPVGLQLAARRGGERALMGIVLAAERRLGRAIDRLGRPPMAAA
jgi:aspartyl-tRNA(Asn)/glutamyl-tRNA(Gln) amidotransferase subunit A